MRKFHGVALIFGLLLCCMSSISAQTITIDIVPPAQDVVLGDPVEVDLIISGLGDGLDPSLGTFDLDLTFDPAILSFQTATFGDQLNVIGLGSITQVAPGVMNVNLFELSLDPPVDLDILQQGNFTLATLSFATEDVGSSSLDLFINDLGDALGDPLSASVTSGLVTVEPEPEADVGITKSDAVDPVTVGDNITYTLVVFNDGPDDAENVVMTDTLPSGVVFVSATPDQGSCSESGGIMTCNLGTMTSGSSVSIVLVVTTTTDGGLPNSASVTSDTNDPNLSNNDTTEETTVEPQKADVGITKSDAVDPVKVGDNVTYTVAVSNGGPGEAENVVVTDTLPSGVVFVSATPSQGSCSESGGTVTCNLGSMANGSSTNIVIVVTTTTDGTLTDIATVTSDTPDPNEGNNVATEQTTVEPPAADLGITKSDAADPVKTGDNVTYTVAVSNGGPDAAQNVVVTDTLPSGVVFVSATPGQGSCSESGGTVTCNLGSVANGSSANIVIVVTTTTDGTLTDTATVTSDTPDPNEGNNVATEQTTVEPQPADLGITKSDAADPVKTGDNVTYTVVVSNGGPGSAENVVVTDTLPSGVQFVSATPDQGSCSESGGIVTCNLGTVANGSSVNIVIVVQATTHGELTNTVIVVSDTDPNPGNNSAMEQTTVERQADVGITKSDAVDPVTAGDNVTYTMVVSNGGPDAAQNVVVTDTPPSGVVFVSATPDQGSCSHSGGIVTCLLGTVANGSSVNIVLVVETTTDGVLTNAVIVVSDTDPNPDNNRATEQTTVGPKEADLGVSKSDAVDPVTVGDNVTYTLVVSNNGPNDAENVVVTDTLPSGVVFVSATPDQGSCVESGGIVTCNLGSLANGSSVSIVLVVTTTTDGQLTNSASVTSDTPDPNPGNNGVSEDTTVEPPPGADLGITKSDVADPVTVGDNVTYTVVVSNDGPGLAENVVVTDTLPSGVVFVSATPDQGSCVESGGIVTCNLGSLANGSSVSIVVVVTTTTDGQLTNSVSVTSDTPDPNLGNNGVSEDTTVEPPPPLEADLGVTKSDAADPVIAGDDVTYTVVVFNDGPGSAENVVVTDTLPSGVVFVSATPDQGSCSESGGIVTCNLGTVANGSSVNIVLVVETTTDGGLTNSVSVTSDTPDPNPGNNGVSEDTTVEPPPPLEADLGVTKSDASDPVLAGDDVTYTVVVFNNGPNDAENVMVTDTLPSGVVFVSATPDQGSCSESGGTVTCNLGSLANGSSVTIVLVVITTAEDTLTNTASVESDTDDPNGENDSAEEETTVLPVPVCSDDVLISNYQTTAGDQFVELANVGSGPIDLDGCTLVTFNVITERSIEDATKDLDGRSLDPGETTQVAISDAPEGPGAIGIFNVAEPPAANTLFTTLLPDEITGMVYLDNDSVFGIAHLTKPEHNDIYDCIYGTSLPPGNFPRTPLDECFDGPK